MSSFFERKNLSESCAQCKWDRIYLDAWDGPDHDIDIYQNIVHDNGGDGICIAIEQEGGSLRNIGIYNNIVYDNAASGIAISSYFFPTPRENIKIMNNVLYNNGHDGINVGDVAVKNSVIRDNICTTVVASFIYSLIEMNLKNSSCLTF